jgi:hypothetical protein
MRGHWGRRFHWWIAPIAVAAFAAFGFILMLLWNWLMPALFALPHLGFWQAWGLLILCKILFGGIHGHHGHKRWERGRMRRVIERWEEMTPEEREKFRRKMREGCGHFSSEAEPQA